jgi:hypothetical protein
LLLTKVLNSVKRKSLILKGRPYRTPFLKFFIFPREQASNNSHLLGASPQAPGFATLYKSLAGMFCYCLILLTTYYYNTYTLGASPQAPGSATLYISNMASFICQSK